MDINNPKMRLVDTYLKRRSEPGTFLHNAGYKYLKPLGFGMNARVGLFEKDNQTYAVRILDLPNIIIRNKKRRNMDDETAKAEVQRDIAKEKAVINQINSLGPDTCKETFKFLLDYQIIEDPATSETIYSISQPMKEDLYNFVKHFHNNNASKEEMLRITRALLCELFYALYCLHRIGVIHGDLKLQNILIDNQGQIKLADFSGSGLYQRPELDKFYQRVTVLSPSYTAPEVLGKWLYPGAPSTLQEQKQTQYLAQFSPKLDSWSLGVVIMALLDKDFYESLNKDALGFHTQDDVNEKIADIVEEMDKEHRQFFYQLLYSLLQLNPNTRWSVSEMIEKQPNFFDKICGL